MALGGAPASAAVSNSTPTHPRGNPALGLAPTNPPTLTPVPAGSTATPEALQPDFAYGQCIDYTNAQPTAVHYGPSYTSDTGAYFNNNTEVGGSCFYYNNTAEHRWYMEIYIGNNYGYIWVQRLVHGSSHICIVNGVDAEKIYYGNYCDLIDYTP